jgi:hypothetical protein
MPSTVIGPCNISGRLHSHHQFEGQVIAKISRILHYMRSDHYLCSYEEDSSGDLMLRFENGQDEQVITIEAGAWPEAIPERVLCELKF